MDRLIERGGEVELKICCFLACRRRRRQYSAEYLLDKLKIWIQRLRQCRLNKCFGERNALLYEDSEYKIYKKECVQHY